MCIFAKDLMKSIEMNYNNLKMSFPLTSDGAADPCTR